MNEIEGTRMGPKTREQLIVERTEQIKAELRIEFPHISEEQVIAIGRLKVEAEFSEPVSVRENLVTVDMGDDRDLSLNYKKYLWK